MKNFNLFIISFVFFFSLDVTAQTDFVKGVLKTNYSTLTGYVRISKSVGHIVKSKNNPSQFAIKKQALKHKETYTTTSYNSFTGTTSTLQRTYYFPIVGLEQNIYFTRDLSEPSQRLQAYRCKSFEDEKGNYYEVVRVPLQVENRTYMEEKSDKEIAVMGLRIVNGLVSVYQVHYRKHELYVLKRSNQDDAFTTKKKEIKPLLRRYFYDDEELLNKIDEIKKWDLMTVINLVSSYNERNDKY
ncbi:hypothetical protein [Flammeovirga sp. SJP92]|uniref:hypothetical protein n=1 Tax=Flammeovirga sp. SJP92 TaxID=1775430 RepID=UPI0007896665|nr:hypothetical protein [Flammeovirga sp. SJP92]KXX70750.1 hypothetical protein AVL50_08010 [Flammeovirga sp. SJP92]